VTSRDHVHRFRELVTERLGLRFDDDPLPLLGELLEDRIRATGARFPDDYLTRAADDEGELGELASRLSVSETYFLRNAPQLEVFSELARQRLAAGSGPFRVLSAGSSSGEEAYSLAILLRETCGHVDPARVSIVGIDLDPRAVEKARAARYSEWSLRDTLDAIRQRYFRRAGSELELDDSIRRMVRFEQRNLLRPDPGFWRRGAFDVVFCRNVLMYFTQEAARGVVDRIAHALDADGSLFLGHAENLRRLSRDFHLRHERSTFYYARRSAPPSAGPPIAALAETGGAAAAAPVLPDDVSWFEAIARSSRRIAELSRAPSGGPAEAPDALRTETRRRAPAPGLGPAMRLVEQERFQDALAMLGEAFGETADVDALLLRAALLVIGGDAGEAERVCRRILEADELEAGAHYVLALCREHRGDHDGAVEHDRMAVHLDAGFAMPRVHLGLLARRTGDLEAARHELRLALELLAVEDAGRVVLFGGGFGRGGLMRLCEGELRACEEGTE